MMIRISPRVVYVPRSEWGPDSQYPRLGYNVIHDRRTHVIHHHTVVIDSDATPNLWETWDEVYEKMRQLQSIRPDLGLDVPYNFVGFLMRDTFEDAALVVCEGRGFYRTGAHTHGHNTAAFGFAIEGNLELSVGPYGLSPWVVDISQFWYWAKYHPLAEAGPTFRFLGSVRPAHRATYGHFEFISTACPGEELKRVIRDITIDVDYRNREQLVLAPIEN